MLENLNIGNLRIIFEGKKPFTLNQISNILIHIENIFKNFSNYIFDNNNVSLIIEHTSNKPPYFDLTPFEDGKLSLKYSDFEEIIMCSLYSIYSSTFENELSTIEDDAKEIQTEAFKIMNHIKEGNSLGIIALIDDKLVQLKILPANKIKLEKYNPTKKGTVFKSKEEILETLKGKSEEGFVKCNLENFDLSFVDFSNVNFFEADLFKINLNNSNLSNTNFFGADVSNATLNEAILTNAYLVEADFSSSELKKTTLEGANLFEADFSLTNLEEATFSDINISSTDLSGSNLTGAVFKGDIEYDSNTDFGNSANWWDAKIENSRLYEWLKKNYPKKNS